MTPVSISTRLLLRCGHLPPVNPGELAISNTNNAPVHSWDQPRAARNRQLPVPDPIEGLATYNFFFEVLVSTQHSVIRYRSFLRSTECYANNCITIMNILHLSLAKKYIYILLMLYTIMYTHTHTLAQEVPVQDRRGPHQSGVEKSGVQDRGREIPSHCHE